MLAGRQHRLWGEPLVGWQLPSLAGGGGELGFHPDPQSYGKLVFVTLGWHWLVSGSSGMVQYKLGLMRKQLFK